MKFYLVSGICGIVMYIVLNWIGKLFEVEYFDFVGMKFIEYLKFNLVGVVLMIVDDEGFLSEGLVIFLKLVDDNLDVDIGLVLSEVGCD